MEVNGMKLNGMEWNWMEWKSMEFNGNEKKGMWNRMLLNWKELNGMKLNGLEWNWTEWNLMELNGKESGTKKRKASLTKRFHIISWVLIINLRKKLVCRRRLNCWLTRKVDGGEYWFVIFPDVTLYLYSGLPTTYDYKYFVLLLNFFPFLSFYLFGVENKS